MVHENLNGRVAVITGGGGVLCSGFAKDLAAQGVKVAILDLREDAAKKVADEINAAGGTALAVGCNVLESESLEAAREKINRRARLMRYPDKRRGRQLPARHNHEGHA